MVVHSRVGTFSTITPNTPAVDLRRPANLRRCSLSLRRLWLSPWTRYVVAGFCLAAGLLIATASGVVWFRNVVMDTRVSVAPLDISGVLFDATPLVITIAAGGERAEWHTTGHELLTSPALWRRMNLAQWNDIPESYRQPALDNMLARYRRVVTEPRVWDAMRPADWDNVPQPMRPLTSV